MCQDEEIVIVGTMKPSLIRKFYYKRETSLATRLRGVKRRRQRLNSAPRGALDSFVQSSPARPAAHPGSTRVLGAAARGPCGHRLPRDHPRPARGQGDPQLRECGVPRSAPPNGVRGGGNPERTGGWALRGRGQLPCRPGRPSISQTRIGRAFGSLPRLRRNPLRTAAARRPAGSPASAGEGAVTATPSLPRGSRARGGGAEEACGEEASGVGRGRRH